MYPDTGITSHLSTHYKAIARNILTINSSGRVLLLLRARLLLWKDWATPTAPTTTASGVACGAAAAPLQYRVLLSVVVKLSVMPQICSYTYYVREDGCANECKLTWEIVNFLLGRRSNIISYRSTAVRIIKNFQIFFYNKPKQIHWHFDIIPIHPYFG